MAMAGPLLMAVPRSALTWSHHANTDGAPCPPLRTLLPLRRGQGHRRPHLTDKEAGTGELAQGHLAGECHPRADTGVNLASWLLRSSSALPLDVPSTLGPPPRPPPSSWRRAQAPSDLPARPQGEGPIGT